jgi:hypothetical protein
VRVLLAFALPPVTSRSCRSSAASCSFCKTQIDARRRAQRRKRPLIKGPKEFRNNSRGFGKAEEKVIIPQGLLRIEVH